MITQPRFINAVPGDMCWWELSCTIIPLFLPSLHSFSPRSMPCWRKRIPRQSHHTCSSWWPSWSPRMSKHGVLGLHQTAHAAEWDWPILAYSPFSMQVQSTNPHVLMFWGYQFKTILYQLVCFGLKRRCCCLPIYELGIGLLWKLRAQWWLLYSKAQLPW